MPVVTTTQIQRLAETTKRDVDIDVENAREAISEITRELTRLDRQLADIQDHGLAAQNIPHSIGGTAMDVDVRKMSELAMRCGRINQNRHQIVHLLHVVEEAV